ncbi:MAG: hypothetical protein KY445_15940 [Armatimonadetes bacterium]|nr:hypothetical protein [Armatimonadota bacterium]
MTTIEVGTKMLTGIHGDYHWMELEDGFMRALLERFPQIILGKSLVNTSFDSGQLTLSPDETERGWRKHNEVTLIPLLVELDDFPTDYYDEWYVFDLPTAFDEHEVFVNYCGFSLSKSVWEEFQQRFWNQLEVLQPESYLAEGINLIWVTKNNRLFEQVILSLKNASLQS